MRDREGSGTANADGAGRQSVCPCGAAKGAGEDGGGFDQGS